MSQKPRDFTQPMAGPPGFGSVGGASSGAGSADVTVLLLSVAGGTWRSSGRCPERTESPCSESLFSPSLSAGRPPLPWDMAVRENWACPASGVGTTQCHPSSSCVGAQFPGWPQNLGWSLSFQKKHAGLALDRIF